ncbi:ABC transporter substrate-binding protein [Streptomyces sp. NPDC091376]|uniref:ABC transporter substrate-binding protein n=1 Tax=Streptomyces sp. NPDC091376 TaxID=3365994 RepID=UPI0037FF28E7
MGNRLARTGAAIGVVAALGACSTNGGAQDQSPEFTGRGPITLAAGKDNSGTLTKVVDRWNKAHSKEPVRIIDLSDSPDEQRRRMIQNAELKSGEFTVLSLDTVWTAEFAANRWVLPIPEDAIDPSAFLKPTVEGASYRGHMYAVPETSDGGLLFYRKDLLQKAGAKPPATWGQMRQACDKVLALPEAEGMSCYAGQFEKYEGLTVNFAEMVNGAGGLIMDAEGRPAVDSPEAERGLQFFVEAFKEGLIPKKAITFKEEEGRQAFQGGRLVFHRQWPYQYALASNEDGSSKVSGRFSVAPLPGMDGPGVSSLGGHNLAVSAFAKNKATALDFVKFMTSEKMQREKLLLNSNAPTLGSLYDEKSLIAKYPYLPVLKQSILSATPRPRVVRYGDATTAIQESAYSALKGETTPREALRQLQGKLERISQGE